MRAHFLQHVHFEGPGYIRPWLDRAGWDITSTRLFESERLPDLEAVDLFVILGGSMSVKDERRYLWLAREKLYIRSAIETGKSVLGICLGAQLIADAMGARVYRNRVKEIGWYPIQGVADSDQAVFKFPPSLAVFHWHGETFDLPAGAVHLARSEGCENQAFQLGSSVIGLQFHLETTPESMREIINQCRGELKPSRYVQSEVKMLEGAPEKCRRVNNLMVKVLQFLVAPGGIKEQAPKA